LSVLNQAASASIAADAALALVQPVAEARDIALESRCRDAAIVYDGDPDRTRQILLNLLNNAVKFTQPGGRVIIDCGTQSRPDLHVRMPQDVACVFVRVSDTGVGIPRERIVSIFDPFVQVEGGHTRPSDGSGLGLTISRRLARLMGGDLTAQSEHGKGSMFTLWLREASSTQREAARWRTESPDTASRLQGLSDVGRTLLRDLPSLSEAFVERLRAEAIVPGALSLRSSQLADHVATYVADIASMLSAIEEARGQPSRLVADGAQIQVHVAEHHGAQRARLGWTPDTLRREWKILCEEIARVVHRAVGTVSERVVAEAMIVLERFLEQGEESSVRALIRATQPADPTDEGTVQNATNPG
jgi:hypothetical protein